MKIAKMDVSFSFSSSVVSVGRLLTISLRISILMTLTVSIVVSLALICTFSRMRSHLGLGEVGQENVPLDTILAVAETLKESSSLKVSEDGMVSVPLQFRRFSLLIMVAEIPCLSSLTGPLPKVC